MFKFPVFPTAQIDSAPQTYRTEAKRASKRILVISGQAVIRDLLERFFQIDGHFVSTAADGEEGISRAKSLPVDLIVLDNGLPTSGTVRAQLRAEAATAHLPVLWVGARLPRLDFEFLTPADADDVLPMPFSFVQMRETANRLLGRAA